jgi:hypothetical protein
MACDRLLKMMVGCKDALLMQGMPKCVPTQRAPYVNTTHSFSSSRKDEREMRESQPATLWFFWRKRFAIVRDKTKVAKLVLLQKIAFVDSFSPGRSLKLQNYSSRDRFGGNPSTQHP